MLQSNEIVTHRFLRSLYDSDDSTNRDLAVTEAAHQIERIFVERNLFGGDVLTALYLLRDVLRATEFQAAESGDLVPEELDEPPLGTRILNV